VDGAGLYRGYVFHALAGAVVLQGVASTGFFVFYTSRLARRRRSTALHSRRNSRGGLDKASDQVLGMFQREGVKGVKVLFQKRLRRDWKMLGDYRREQSDKAKTRWKREQERKAEQYGS
jgi:hypothetical protein